MKDKGYLPTPELLKEIQLVREKGPLFNTEVPVPGADFMASPDDIAPLLTTELLKEEEPKVVELDSPIGAPSIDEEESLEGFSSMADNLHDADEDTESEGELEDLHTRADGKTDTTMEL